MASYAAIALDAPRPPMVDFRGHDGRFLAVPYRRFVSVSLLGDSHIEVELSRRQIDLHGRNLAPLYRLLVEHRVTYVQEGDLDVLSESETFVDRIVIAPTEPTQAGSA